MQSECLLLRPTRSLLLMHLRRLSGSSSFRKTGFRLCHILSHFVCLNEIVRDPDVFPRNNDDMAVIARQASDHPRAFKPGFYDFAGFSEESKYNAFFGEVPAPKNRLLQKQPNNPV